MESVKALFQEKAEVRTEARRHSGAAAEAH